MQLTGGRFSCSLGRLKGPWVWLPVPLALSSASTTQPQQELWYLYRADRPHRVRISSMFTFIRRLCLQPSALASAGASQTGTRQRKGYCKGLCPSKQSSGGNRGRVTLGYWVQAGMSIKTDNQNLHTESLPKEEGRLAWGGGRGGKYK